MIKLLLIIIIDLFFILYFKNISRFINIFDFPDNKRKIHTTEVASIGGVLIFLNIIFSYLLLKNESYIYDVDFTLIFFCFLFFLIGLIDDKFTINHNIKLMIFVVLTFLFLKIDSKLINNINFSFHETKDLGKYSLIFSIFCIVVFINALNMFDGINFQSAIYSTFIFSIFITNNFYALLSFSVILSLIFFLYLNYKNLCFLGDNGTILLGFLISALFVKSSHQQLFYADEILLIMLIPGIDLIRLFISRILEKNNPFKPDKNHFHHLMLNKFGLYKSNIILFALIIFPYIIAKILNMFLIMIILSIIVYIFIYMRMKQKI
tara:strand:- start:1083 stop:2045 length:963 start_codon:yes stop_codon:yes gene_type:complete